MRLAAIDIGSNAARLLIKEVLTSRKSEPYFNKLNLVRVPLRLGLDVFSEGKISDKRIDMVLRTMKAYRHLMDAYEVDHYIACATSAMRDAANTDYIILRVKMETGISIDVISGSNEASLIYENHIAENMDSDHTYLYVDVGGGSTELSLFGKGKLIFKESFNIGTIRLLQESIKEADWEKMKERIRKKLKGIDDVVLIGTGGNINKIFSLSKRKDGKPLGVDTMREFYREFNGFSVEERMERYGMRRDRADVIVPALQIFNNIMRWADAKEIYVPKIGLADGLINHLYDEVAKKL